MGCGFLGRNRIDEHHIDRAEDAHAIQVALRLIERVLLEGLTGSYRRDAPDGAGIHVPQAADLHLADPRVRAGLRIQLHFGP